MNDPADSLDAEAHIRRGQELARLRRWPEAVAAYRRGTELAPGSAPAHTALGRTLAITGAWAEAADAYRQALLLSPSSAAYHDLGDALLKLRRFAAAADAFREADALNPAWSRRDAGAAVAPAERWIDALRTAPAPRDRVPRTLFVLDNDYGELTTAMYLLLGQDLAAGATLLLPPRLFVTNADALPGRTHPYTSIDDVLRVVDAQPDVVFLCSAYLYALHAIVDNEALDRLVGHARQRGARVVTSDPFLGLLAEPGRPMKVSVDIPPDAPQWLAELKAIEDERLKRLLGGAAAIVGGLPHLYPSCPPSLPGRFSFFNPALRYPPDAPDGGATAVWLFVLSSRDYERQLMQHGREGFAAALARRFVEASRAGRHPVFIGPHDCVQAVVEHVGDAGVGGGPDGMTLLTFSSFSRFSALLLGAEYAFYWNALSHSMFLRLFNGLPVFLFDRGHLVRNVPTLYPRVVDWYYHGAAPIYLDPDRDLGLDDLGRLADAYRQAAGGARTRAERLPPPGAMIDQLLR